jgi:hypothetical protein
LGLRYGAFILGWFGYVLLASAVSLAFEWTQALTELPLLLMLYAALQLPLRRNAWRAPAAALPLLWMYLVHDVALGLLGTVLCFYDFAVLPDLFRSLSAPLLALACLLLAAPLVLWLLAVDWRGSWLSWRALPAALLAAGWFLLVFGFPGRCYETMNAITPDEEWSDRLTAEHWGRLYTVFMREARRLSFLDELDRAPTLEETGMDVRDESLGRIRPRNVHLIVLESFLDVRELSAARFSRPPLDEAFASWVGDGAGLSRSPCFGGETARAEFELLCGVPSLRLYGIEFLAFGGGPAPCLPNRLRRAGFRTMLSFPGGPVYANSRLAYPGLGFSERIFGDLFSPVGAPSLRLSDGDVNLFDGDLFDQNLAMVRQWLADGRPFFNYVLTLYGHFPFHLDPRRFPLVARMQPPLAEVERIANQMHYRAIALREYLQELQTLDPHSLIIVVGDHLPPLPDGELAYQRLGYLKDNPLARERLGDVAHLTFLLLFDAGQVVPRPLLRHFDVPHWVLDRLTEGAYCREKPGLCRFGEMPLDAAWRERYQAVLSLAARAAGAE